MRMAIETYLKAAMMGNQMAAAIGRVAGYGMTKEEIDSGVAAAQQAAAQCASVMRPTEASRGEVLNGVLAAYVMIGKGQYDNAVGKALGAAEKALARGLDELMKFAATIYLRAEVLRYNTLIGLERVGRYGLDRDEAARISDDAEKERESRPRPPVYDF